MLYRLLALFCWSLAASTHAAAPSATPAGTITTVIPAAPSDFAAERATLKAFDATSCNKHWSDEYPDSSTNGWLGPCYCQWVGVYCVDKTACDGSLVGAVYRVGEGTVEVGSDGCHGSAAAAAAADKEGTKKMDEPYSLDELSKVSLLSVGKFIPTSILFEVKKTVEAVGKSAIRSNDDVKRDSEKLVWPMGWCQVRPLLQQSVVSPRVHGGGVWNRSLRLL